MILDLIEIFAYGAITYAVMSMMLSGFITLILAIVGWLWGSVPEWNQ